MNYSQSQKASKFSVLQLKETEAQGVQPGQNHGTSRDVLQLVLWHLREQAEREVDMSF